jgi:hypothetical protein
MKKLSNVQLIKFLLTNNYINHDAHQNLNKSSSTTINKIYDLIVKADSFTREKMTIPSATHSEIRPDDFSGIPDKPRAHIEANMNKSPTTYTISFFGRTVNIHFFEETAGDSNALDDYVRRIMTWLYIVNDYASPACSNILSIFIYLTSLKKELPETAGEVMGYNNANTGLTRTCLPKSEILIYRKEEWFKVFIHESFHNFSLDFSSMNVSDVTSKILQVFKIKSEVNLFEAYTEIWAEIMNICFCSYYTSETKREYMNTCETVLNIEMNYGVFQMIKVLKFMNTNYEELLNGTAMDKYKENTNILSYYIITTILLVHFEEFFGWCSENNTNIFQFNNTQETLGKFFNFIESHHNSESLMEMVEFFKSERPDYDFLRKTLMMTICNI